MANKTFCVFIITRKKEKLPTSTISQKSYNFVADVGGSSNVMASKKKCIKSTSDINHSGRAFKDEEINLHF